MLLGTRVKNYRFLTDMKAGMLADEITHYSEDPQAAFSAGLSPVFPLTNLVAFVGRNDTGKSGFLDALSFVSDTLKQGCRNSATLAGRGGFTHLQKNKDAPVSASMLFSLCLRTDGEKRDCYVSYDIDILADRYGRPYISKEIVRIREEKPRGGAISFSDVLLLENGAGQILHEGVMRKAGVADSLISGVTSYGALLEYPILTALYQEIAHWFFCHFSSGKKPNIPVAPGAHRHLNAAGSNAENVLRYIEHEDPERYARLMMKIRSKIPQVKHNVNLPDFFKESPNKLFLYLLLLEDSRPNPLIFMETPSEGLYHDMVDVLATEFREYVLRHQRTQLFFSTHNPYILESLAPSEVWIFSRDDSRTHATYVHCAGASPVVSEMYKQGVGMGAIWYAGHFEDEE